VTLLATSTLIGLGACVPAHTPTVPAAATSNIVEGMQVGLGPCVTTQPPTGKGLTDTVLTALVSKGVNLIGSALTEAGKDKTWKVMGSRNLPGGAGFPACVQVVRGRFKTDAPAAGADWLTAYAAIANPYEQLKKNGVWPADKPDFFFEGVIVKSEDKTAATIRPVFAVLNEPQGTRSTGGEERSVVAFFAFSTAGTRPDLNANPAATVVLGSMVPGRILKFPAAGTVEGASTPYEASWFTLSESDARKPLTMTSLISETQSGSPFLAFLASIFNDEAVKKAITERANVILVPGAASAAEDKETKEQRTAADTADTKLADAITKLVDCKAAPAKDVLTKGALAKAALRSYLAADASLPTPTKKITDADIALINLYAPETVSEQCNSMHEKLTGKRIQ
jgi:hypothetical protein